VHYSASTFLALTNLPRSQALDLGQLGEHPSGVSVTFYERVLPPDLLSLGFDLPKPRPSYAIDCTSHVSSQRFCFFRVYAYAASDSSFAIWDRNKVAVAIATIAWVINVSLQLKSEFPHCISVMVSSDEHG